MIKPANLHDLTHVIHSLKSPSEVELFLQDLCTAAEIQAMTGRWEVAKMLKKNIPYRQINKLTGVSTATITRVAKFIDSNQGGYRCAFKREAQEQQ